MGEGGVCGDVKEYICIYFFPCELKKKKIVFVRILIYLSVVLCLVSKSLGYFKFFSFVH